MSVVLAIILLMSLVCLGLNISMKEGQILHWMRRPFTNFKQHCINVNDKLKEDIILDYNNRKQILLTDYNPFEISKEDADKRNKELDELRVDHESSMQEIEENLDHIDGLFWYLKPILLCVWCFASFWGSIVFWSIHLFYLNDCGYNLIGIWLVSVFATVFFNALFDGVLRKLEVYE